METHIHPARQIPFTDLYSGLQKEFESGHVNETTSADGLKLYCYSQRCVYEKAWNDFSLMARGLILDTANRRVVATPFPKFFNVGERMDSIPNMEFETFEKLDGSLIIIFHHGGRWRCATKGSFKSEQAAWAESWLKANGDSGLITDSTYLAEAIYPENRIVVSYGSSGLHMLSGYDETGREFSYDEIASDADALGWPIAARHSYSSLSDLLAEAKALPANREGFVLRFANGLRLKVKGDEYCRIHKMISRVTPLAIWEAMQAGDDLEAFRRQLPEEFWGDFDTIKHRLQSKAAAAIGQVRHYAEPLAGLTDKEVGLRLATLPESVRRFIFPYRKYGVSGIQGLLYRSIRPDGNRLEGYEPSGAMHKIMDV